MHRVDHHAPSDPYALLLHAKDILVGLLHGYRVSSWLYRVRGRRASPTLLMVPRVLAYTAMVLDCD